MLDKHSKAYVKSELAMRKWFTSLVLLAALTGSVTAGVPMHAGMNEEMMGCCKAALAHDDSPATSAARLCCALNCPEPGTTSATVPQTGSVTTTVMIAALPQVVSHNLNPTFINYSVLPRSTNLQPTYILNLALLI